MTAPPAILLRNFGVAFGGRPVLVDVDLALPATGTTILVGAGGAGKSTLLRTVAGLNHSHPAFSTWGDAELGGKPLFGTAQPRGVALVVQHSRFFMSTVRENLVSALPNRSRLLRRAQTELARSLLRRSGLAHLTDQLDVDVVKLPPTTQRLLAIVRATAEDPAVLLADEPTAGLDDDAAIDVIALLRAQAALRAVVIATHNRKHAQAAGGTTCLLAGGRIVECTPTRRFLEAPITEEGRRFLATGGSALPSPGASETDLDESSPRPPPLSGSARTAVAQSDVGPRGFFWVLPKRLGGLPRPGILDDVEQDLAGLERLGISVLVTLEETATVEPAALVARRIEHLHFPIPDMAAPALGPAMLFCADLEARMTAGAVVAIHCRAGLGRTGTLLAAQLVWSGETAVCAIERVRHINPRCIQSDEQVAFLRAFEDTIRPATPTTIPPACLENLTQPRRTPNVA